MHGAFEIGAQAATRLVQFCIGREGHVVERRDEASGHDQRQEQRLGIEPQLIDRENAPRDEDVALALDDPEQLAQCQRTAEPDHSPGAPEIEHRAHPQPRRYAHDHCPDRDSRDRCIDQRPDAEAVPCQRERRGCSDRGRHQIGDPLAAKFEPPREQRGGQGSEGDGEEDQRLHAQQPGDLGLTVVIGHDRGQRQLRGREQAVGQQEQREHLPDLAVADPVGLDQRAGKAPAIQEVECSHDHLAHGEQAVVGGLEQPHDHDRRSPGDELRDQLAAPAPGQRLAHARAKTFGGIVLGSVAHRHACSARRDSSRLRGARRPGVRVICPESGRAAPSVEEFRAGRG